ncbi:MAG TPA: glycosyltransferase family 4 protein [Anaerolineales bacterium]|nr:glycosyltransferase family 4 protein [Anaerolineales bacterium]
MKILLLIHEFPPIGGGGGKIALDTARELVRRGHRVHAITPSFRGLPLRSNVDGIRITRLPSFRRQLYAADLLAMSSYLAVGFLTGLWSIWHEHPDLIHVHFAVPAGALAWSLSKVTGVPYVLTTHLGDVPGGVPEKTDRWFQWVYPFTPRIWRDAAQVTAVSESTRQLALKRYPRAIQVIPNGISLEDIPVQNVWSHCPPQIAFAGRLVPQKNPIEVVRILSRLKDLEWACTIMGDGPLEGAMRAEIRAHGLERRITMTGWLETGEVSSRLAQSDILFMPSLSEGLPMAALQAVGVGLALVVSRVGGLAEIVKDGTNGFLLEPGDSQGFEACLRRLLSTPEMLRAMRQASLIKSREFDIGRVADEYIRVFEQTISRK